jgi:glycerol-3-phosphate acyltransferase PlsY
MVRTLDRAISLPRLNRVPLIAYFMTLVLAYLVGSIPTGYLVARARGVDIRSLGSGNIGATNAMRVLGRTVGLMVLFMDFAKGLLACLGLPLLAHLLFGPEEYRVGTISLGLAAAVGVVIGHNFTIWLRFKGGKGIATTAGVLAALVPWALVIALSVWVLLLLATRYVSVGSVAAAVAMPVATWFTSHGDILLTVMTSVLGIMAIWKHKGNLQRLVAGTESRFHLKKKSGGSA